MCTEEASVDKLSTTEWPGNETHFSCYYFVVKIIVQKEEKAQHICLSANRTHH